MKLYVCYGTWTTGGSIHKHPCGEAHRALTQAGYRPEVIRSYGLGLLPGMLNDLTHGRRKVKELTGNYWVPVLVADDGAVVQGSKRIIAWAQANPAAAEAAPA
jgi:Glutathione S-transferase, N-terminal domain